MKDLQKTITLKGRRYLLRVESSDDPADYIKYENLRNLIWGFPDDHLSGERNLLCENFLHEGSALFLGAFASARDGSIPVREDNLVGFSYGFVGIHDKTMGFRDPGNLRFYSQFAGVRPDFQVGGLGVAIKEFQREVLLEVFGIGTVVCTYDPLTGINAHRNIHHFGMEVLEYRVAPYGEYGGLLNRRDVPSDRFFMSWDLKAPPRSREHGYAGPAPGNGEVLIAEINRVSGKSCSLDLEVVRGTNLSLDEEFLPVRIPSDYYKMLLETDVEDPEVRRIPVDWRMATREVFTAYFVRGYRVIDFLRTGEGQTRSFYLLGNKRSGCP